jgi:NADPH2:quinone reductase
LIPTVKAATGNKGVDVVLESVGGQVLEDSLTLLRSFGRLVTLGIASGEAPKIDPMRLLTRNLTVSGLYLSTMEARLVRGGLLAGLAMVYAGKVRPVVGHTYPLDQVARAHALLESRNSFGKVVLTV